MPTDIYLLIIGVPLAFVLLLLAAGWAASALGIIGDHSEGQHDR